MMKNIIDQANSNYSYCNNLGKQQNKMNKAKEQNKPLIFSSSSQAQKQKKNINIG